MMSYKLWHHKSVISIFLCFLNISCAVKRQQRSQDIAQDHTEETLAQAFRQTPEGCVQIDPIQKLGLTDTSSLTMNLLETRSTVIGHKDTSYGVWEILAQGTSHKHFIYFTAKNKATGKKYDGFIRRNTAFDPRLPSVRYEITACQGDWVDYSQSVSNLAKLRSPLYPQREFYCGPKSELEQNFSVHSDHDELKKQALSLYKEEIRLHQLLYQFRDRAYAGLKELPEDHPLATAIKNMHSLSEMFHIFLLEKDYQLAYQQFAQEEQQLLSKQQLTLTRDSTGKDLCIRVDNLSQITSTQKFSLTSQKKLQFPGIFLLSFGSSLASQWQKASITRLREFTSNNLWAMEGFDEGNITSDQSYNLRAANRGKLSPFWKKTRFYLGVATLVTGVIVLATLAGTGHLKLTQSPINRLVKDLNHLAEKIDIQRGKWLNRQQKFVAMLQKS